MQRQREDNSNDLGDLSISAEALPWQDMIASVFRHRRMVAAVFLVGTVLATLSAWMAAPTYTARALLMVKDNRSRLAVSPDKGTGALLDRTGEQEINSLVELIRSKALIREILEEHESQSKEKPAEAEPPGLVSRITSLPSEIYREAHDVPAPDSLEKNVNAVQGGLNVSSITRSNLIEVTYTHANPHWASMLVNDLVKKVITRYTELLESSGAREFFQEQREVLAAQLEEAQVKLSAFREKMGPELLLLDPEQVRTRIGALEAELVNTQTVVAELRAGGGTGGLIGFTDPLSDERTSAAIEDDGGVQSLRGRIVELELERSELLSRYTPESTAVVDLNRQIAEAKRLLAQQRVAARALERETAEARITVLTARMDTISQHLDDYRSKLDRLDVLSPELQRLTNEVETQRDAYVTYLRKEEEARFSKALDESAIVNVAIAEEAKVPVQPDSGAMVATISIGAVLSLILGIGIALLRDWLDPSVKTSVQAERLVGLPVLGEIQS